MELVQASKLCRGVRALASIYGCVWYSPTIAPHVIFSKSRGGSLVFPRYHLPRDFRFDIGTPSYGCSGEDPNFSPVHQCMRTFSDPGNVSGFSGLPYLPHVAQVGCLLGKREVLNVGNALCISGQPFVRVFSHQASLAGME